MAATMSMEQQKQMAEAGHHYSDQHQQRMQQQTLAAQQANAFATLQRQQSEHIMQQAMWYQQNAEQQKAQAYVQMQEIQVQQRLQEEQHRDAEQKAAQQLSEMRKEAVAREEQKLAMQHALRVQQFQLQQHATEQWYWQQQQQQEGQQWQDTLVDNDGVPAADPAQHQEAPIEQLEATAFAASTARMYMQMENEHGATANPVADPTAAHPAAVPPAAGVPRDTPLRDRAWEQHVADAAYKQHMENNEDESMLSPKQVQQVLDMTTAQLAGHAQNEELDFDWASKAAQLEALMLQCRNKATSHAAETPRTNAVCPTPESTSTARNLQAQFLRVASQIKPDLHHDAAEAMTETGHKRKFNYDDDWPAPPKAMPKTARPANNYTGLPVPPPPLTPEQYEQKMAELAASIPAPPMPPKTTAAKSASQAAWPRPASQPNPPETTSKTFLPANPVKPAAACEQPAPPMPGSMLIPPPAAAPRHAVPAQVPSSKVPAPKAAPTVKPPVSIWTAPPEPQQPHASAMQQNEVDDDGTAEPTRTPQEVNAATSKPEDSTTHAGQAAPGPATAAEGNPGGDGKAQ